MAKIPRKRGKGAYLFFKELGGAPMRAELSKTARILLELGLVRGRVLDYGCGNGHDADAQGWKAYDPYYRPTSVDGKFDTIVVNHVVNILTRKSRLALYEQVQRLLSEGGRAYLSTARNIPVEGKHGPRKRLQNYVVLDLPSVHRDAEEEIYELSAGAAFEDRTCELEDRL